MVVLELGPFLPHGSGYGFVDTMIGSNFLVIRQSTAAIDPPSIEPVSDWLWCHLCYSHGTYLQCPFMYLTPRDIVEEGRPRL